MCFGDAWNRVPWKMRLKENVNLNFEVIFVMCVILIYVSIVIDFLLEFILLISIAQNI